MCWFLFLRDLYIFVTCGTVEYEILNIFSLLSVSSQVCVKQGDHDWSNDENDFGIQTKIKDNGGGEVLDMNQDLSSHTPGL